MRKLILLICLAALGVGCASTPKTPSWAGKSWEDQNTLYFGGISSACQDQACAKNQAYQNAISALAEYVGTTVQVSTQSDLTNDTQQINARFASTTDNLPLGNIKTEQVAFSSEKAPITGYVLVSIAKQEVARAKQKVEAAKKEAAEQQARRQAAGPLTVQGPEDWLDLTGKLEQFLRDNGYQTSTEGKPLTVRVVKFACQQGISMKQLKNCTLQVSTVLGSQRNSFTVKGYGRSEDTARANAISLLMRDLPHDLWEQK